MSERSQIIILHNDSATPLILADAHLDHGSWTDREPTGDLGPEYTSHTGGTWTSGPPDQIAPGRIAVFGSNSSGFLTGTQGHATFTAASTPDDGGAVDIFLNWDVPFVAPNGNGLGFAILPKNFDVNFPALSKTFSISRIGDGADYYQSGFFNWNPGPTNPWDEFVVTATKKRARRYDAIWRPGTAGEQQYYGMQYTTYQSIYDKLWKQGWRVYRLNSYAEDGKTLYDAIFRPGTQGEIQAYGRTYAQFHAQYDELWKKNWRIFILNTYVINGVVYYDAIWHPGTDGEMQAFGRTYAQFQAQYDDLWKKNWRIFILNTYVVNGAVRYDAIWRPGANGEMQAFGRTQAQFQAQYDDLWKKNWRLYLLNTYALNGQVLHDAVWHPGSEAEMQSYLQSFDQYQLRYVDLWKKNWRLEFLRSYEV